MTFLSTSSNFLASKPLDPIVQITACASPMAVTRSLRRVNVLRPGRRLLMQNSEHSAALSALRDISRDDLQILKGAQARGGGLGNILYGLCSSEVGYCEY